MKLYSLPLLGLCLLAACDRNEPLHKGPAPTAKPTTGLDLSGQGSTTLQASAQGLVLDRTSGKITDGSLQKLSLIGDDLLSAGLLVDIIGAVPDEQIHEFKGLLISALKRLAPKAGQPLNPQYAGVLRIARRLKAPDVSSIVLDHMMLLPPYHFPTEPLPGGWGSAELSEHSERGVQGLAASTVVEYGDAQAMQRYRSLLNAAYPELKRVMIWALGKSPDPEDFENLWLMRLQVKDTAMQDTIKRALNAMTVSMERVAKYPDSQIRRSHLTSDQLQAFATKSKERLGSANLLVTLTPWD